MNDLAKIIRDGGHQLVALPDDMQMEGSEVRVRREGRNLVLEPVDAADEPRIPPGHHPRESLPPLSEGARSILESIDAAGAKHAFAAAGAEDIAFEEEGIGIALSDEGLPGLDPGD